MAGAERTGTHVIECCGQLHESQLPAPSSQLPARSQVANWPKSRSIFSAESQEIRERAAAASSSSEAEAAAAATTAAEAASAYGSSAFLFPLPVTNGPCWNQDVITGPRTDSIDRNRDFDSHPYTHSRCSKKKNNKIKSKQPIYSTIQFFRRLIPRASAIYIHTPEPGPSGSRGLAR